MLYRILIVAAACFGGCTAASFPQGTASSTPAAVAPPLPKMFLDGHPDITGELPKGVDVRLAAATWVELVARARPDLVVRPPGYADGRDLMWVEKDAHGKLTFRLDHAFVWKAGNAPAQWVLLQLAGGNYRDLDFEAELVNTSIEVTAKKPEDDHFPNFAVPLASDPANGILYEIGWTEVDDRGTGHYDAQRDLFVWQHVDGRWSYVGEGEGSGSGHTGSEWAGTSMESSAAFVHGVPEIRLRVVDTTGELGEEPLGLADLSERRDFVLTPAPEGGPGTPKLVQKEHYTTAMKDDTVDAIAKRLAMRNLRGLAEPNPLWHLTANGPLTREQAEENAALQHQTREMLERLNPGIVGRTLKEGDIVRVQVD